ncbi:MAG: hypothetical protein ACKVVP_04575, partial [Chloroflexota bacterium]
MNTRRWSPWAGMLLGSVCLIFFTLLARLDWSGTAPSWDASLAGWVQSWNFPGVLPLMIALSWPGWSPQSWIFVLGICAFLYLRGLRFAAPLALIAALSALLVRSLKGWINRLRPDLGLVPDGPLDPSFP